MNQLDPETLTEQRNEAARELVRALLIINGGGAVALLAFLQAIWPYEKGFAKPIIIAVVVLAIGAVSGAAFHLFRHQASWHHQQGDKKLSAKFRGFYLVSASVSLLAFLLAIAIIAVCIWNFLP